MIYNESGYIVSTSLTESLQDIYNEYMLNLESVSIFNEANNSTDKKWYTKLKEWIVDIIDKIIEFFYNAEEWISSKLRSAEVSILNKKKIIENFNKMKTLDLSKYLSSDYKEGNPTTVQEKKYELLKETARHMMIIKVTQNEQTIFDDYKKAISLFYTNYLSNNPESRKGSNLDSDEDFKEYYNDQYSNELFYAKQLGNILLKKEFDISRFDYEKQINDYLGITRIQRNINDRELMSQKFGIEEIIDVAIKMDKISPQIKATIKDLKKISSSINLYDEGNRNYNYKFKNGQYANGIKYALNILTYYGVTFISMLKSRINSALFVCRNLSRNNLFKEGTVNT